MKIGSLFSGGGLGDFGFMAAGMDIAWQCEIDEYCQKVLALRYPESKKYRDIKTLKGADLERVDIITGGFPCQPFSVAGKQKGKEDNRYLWPEMLRVIKECRPRWIVGENVAGIINMALDTVCADLEAEGYEVWPVVFPSHALGAWHKRDRLWIICHAKHDGQLTGQKRRSVTQGNDRATSGQIEAGQPSGSGEQHALMANAGCVTEGSAQDRFSGQPINSQTQGQRTTSGDRFTDGGKDVSNASIGRSQTRGQSNTQGRKRSGQGQIKLCGANPWANYWSIEPAVGRVANGITDRVHRLKMLGNGQVPACTYVIGTMILDIENQITKGEL